MTTYNMTMIMIEDIAEVLPNQMVYIEEFVDYLKCQQIACLQFTQTRPRVQLSRI